MPCVQDLETKGDMAIKLASHILNFYSFIPWHLIERREKNIKVPV